MGIEWALDKLLELFWAIFKKCKREYCWEPKSPMRSSSLVKNISTYPKTFALVDGDVQLNGMIEGADAFLQALRTYILTERHKYPIYGDTYGIEEATSIFEVKDVVEFQRQCNNIALQVMDYFSDWIVEIYRIQRKRNVLIIEIKVSGKAETLLCKVKKLKSIST